MRHPQQMLSGMDAATYRMLAAALNEGDLLPPCTLKLAAALGLTQMPIRDASTMELPFALSQMVQAPVYWELEEEAALALLGTDPGRPDLRGFRLPFPAIWVGVPPLFSLWNPDTGFHRIEGFYLVEDWLPNRMELLKEMGISSNTQLSDLTETELLQIEASLRGPDADVRMYRSVLILGVGESRNGVVREVIASSDGSLTGVNSHRDDTLCSFWIFTEDPERDPIRTSRAGEQSLLRLATNLLMALQEKYLTKRQVVPRPPKSPKKLKRALRRGETFDAFTILHLTPSPAKQPSRKGAHSEPGNVPKARIIAGYWNYFWVKRENIGDHWVHGEKDGKASRLFKIKKWVHHNVIGDPDENRTTLVMK
jgi:hypothetical protein